MSITILGIESSCDDTSAAVIRDEVMLSNVIASQAVHEAYGGVVPELASRAHQQNIIPVVFARRNFFCQRFYDSIEYSSRRCQSFASSCYGSFYQTVSR